MKRVLEAALADRLRLCKTIQERSLENMALLLSLERVCAEWNRQKALCPDLPKDSWMDMAVNDACTIIEELRQEAA